MILTVYLLFVALALIAIFLGYYTGDDFHAFIGLFLLFIISIVLFTGKLEVQTGQNVTNVFNGSTVIGEVETYNYAPVDDWYSQKLGWVLAIGSGFGMAVTLYNMRIERKKKQEDE